MPSKLFIGSLVIYLLNADDAATINRRRTSSASIVERIRNDLWPTGAQAHIGNEVREGQEVPAIVVAVWPDTCNLQCLLDGNDTYWATSKGELDVNTIEFGKWYLPSNTAPAEPPLNKNAGYWQDGKPLVIDEPTTSPARAPAAEDTPNTGEGGSAPV